MGNTYISHYSLISHNLFVKMRLWRTQSTCPDPKHPPIWALAIPATLAAAAAVLRSQLPAYAHRPERPSISQSRLRRAPWRPPCCLRLKRLQPNWELQIQLCLHMGFRRRQRRLHLRCRAAAFFVYFRWLHVDCCWLWNWKLCCWNRGGGRWWIVGIPVRQTGGDGGGFVERAVGLWINATANEFPLDVSVPIVFDFIVCSSR